VKPYSKRVPRKAHVGGNSGAVLLAKVNPTDQVGIRIAQGGYQTVHATAKLRHLFGGIMS